MAMNYLTTIEDDFRRDWDRINLPDHMLKYLWFEVNQWIGEAALDMHDYRLARHHLIKSLVNKLWQQRAYVLLLLAIPPAGVTMRIRNLFAVLKKSLLKIASHQRHMIVVNQIS